jgi:glycine/D-amino acid oxidase-like deaminating enzyme
MSTEVVAQLRQLPFPVQVEAANLRRRELLRSIGAGALLATLGACAPLPPVEKVYQRPYSRLPWAMPRVSMDAVIRVVVGHRPYRAAGFVVRSEKYGAKTLVHNYGHGGGGISLSWGSSALAMQELQGMPPGAAAVIGSGVMGLTSARLLQDAGWQVTIYTRDMWRHTTSNVAAGEWSPWSVYDRDAIAPEFMAQYVWAARIAHHAYTNLTGKDYGIRWLETYALTDRPDSKEPSTNPLSDLFAYQRTLGPGEHPFRTRYARHKVTMQINPGVLLRRLTHDFQQAGGRFVIRTFAEPGEILSLEQNVIFNCTGLGSRDLFDDQGLTAAKGQLVFLPPDPGIDYMTFGGGKGNLYMFPRTDVLLLGGTFKLDDFSKHPEADETERIVTEHQRIFSA